MDPNEGEFRLLFELSAVGIAQVDPATNRIVSANRKFCRLTGYSLEELLTMTFLDITHPEDCRKNLDAIRRVSDRKSDSYLLTKRYIRKDGSVFWARINGTIVFDPEGRPLRTIGIIEDISEQKKIEDELALFRDLINKSIDSVFVNDPETGLIVMVNESACVSLGYSREELLAKKVMEIELTFPDNFSWREHVDEIKKKGSVRLEGVHRRKDGSTFPAEVNVSYALLDSKEYMVAVARDITERKEAELAIRRNESFIRNILDDVDQGFLVIGSDFRIIVANKAFCRLAGRPRPEVLGRYCFEVMSSLDSPCFERGEPCAARITFETGLPDVFRRRQIDPGGNPVYVEVKSFPLEDESGAITKVVQTYNNVTEKHILEEQRLRTQKLEALGTLAGGIAHDFNNLLQGLFGYISLARLNMDDRQKASDLLDKAEQALGFTVNLTNQLLTFSKGGKPVKKRISLGPIIESSVKFVLSGSATEFSIDLGKDLVRVEADGGQIGQVIQNIVINANEAMPEGGQVMISARNVVDPGEIRRLSLSGDKYVEIAIRDSGIGIPQHFLSRIFDPYFTTKQKGSGLGLATSYSIIKNHDGIIDVRSELDKGSTFLVYLPAPGPNVEENSICSPSLYARKGRILVMDDDEDVRIVASEMLSTLGHEVETARDGKAAIEMFFEAHNSGKPFDLVILDLTIRGGMGGEKAMRKLLEIDPGITAVVSSGYAESEAVSNYKVFGFKACLAKPYTYETLKNLLNTLLK